MWNVGALLWNAFVRVQYSQGDEDATRIFAEVGNGTARGSLSLSRAFLQLQIRFRFRFRHQTPTEASRRPVYLFRSIRDGT